MGNYKQLKQAVSNVIKANGNQEITGAILQNALLTIISNVGSDSTFAGIATPTTNPGTPDQNVFYLASEPGIYSNFGGIELTDQVLIFTNKNGNWAKQDSGIATSAKIIELGNKTLSYLRDVNIIDFFKKNEAVIVYGSVGEIASKIEFIQSKSFVYLTTNCKEGDEFVLSGQCVSVNARAYVFLSSDNTILLKSPQNEVLNDTHIIAPKNSNTAYFCFSANSAIKLEKVSTTIREIKNEITELQQDITEINKNVDDIIYTNEGTRREIYNDGLKTIQYITSEGILGTASRYWSVKFQVNKGIKYKLDSNNVTNQTLTRIVGLKDKKISVILVPNESSNFKEYTFVCDGTYDEVLWMLSNAYSIEGTPSIIEYEGYSQFLNPIIQLPSTIYDNVYNRMDNYVAKSNVLYAYANQSDAGDLVDNGTDVFIGYDENNINSIQRAINSIPSDTLEQWYIYAVGEFNVTSFEYFATEDPLHKQSTEDYLCYIALVAKRNIHILGVGNRDTKIICNLPNSGFPTSVANLHPLLIKQTRNCSFHNFFIYGKNVRYTVHVNGTTESVSEKLWFDNVEFDSDKNEGEAATSWPYGSQNIGIDIAPNMELYFTNCINPFLRGHFSPQGWGRHYVSFVGCHFYGDATNVVPSKDIPSMHCSVEYNFVGNKFYGVASFINGNINSDGVSMKISGYGNSVVFVTKPTTYFNEITDIAQIYKTTESVLSGNLVDRYGNLANGRIEAIAVFDSDGEKVICAKNIMYKIDDVILTEDYIPNKGDYLISENGKLKKSEYPTNAYVYSSFGVKYIIVE